jgi:hypothetical protein
VQIWDQCCFAKLSAFCLYRNELIFAYILVARIKPWTIITRSRNALRAAQTKERFGSETPFSTETLLLKTHQIVIARNTRKMSGTPVCVTGTTQEADIKTVGTHTWQARMHKSRIPTPCTDTMLYTPCYIHHAIYTMLYQHHAQTPTVAKLTGFMAPLCTRCFRILRGTCCMRGCTDTCTRTEWLEAFEAGAWCRGQSAYVQGGQKYQRL